MAADSRDMPPVRLLPEAELARLVRSAPLFERAGRLARWAAPTVPVDADGTLGEAELARAGAELGSAEEVAEAWALAVDTGLVEIAADGDGAPAAAAPGKALELLDGGEPDEVLGLWRTGVDAVLAEIAAASSSGLWSDAEEDDWPAERSGSPEEEAAFLDGALANLYLLTALEELERAAATGVLPEPGAAPEVPLPVLAASLVVPDDMEVPTDAVLEEVSEAMMRLDDHFRLLMPTGLVEYRPVDEALIAEEAEAAAGGGERPADPDGDGQPELAEEEVARYGMVRLTPLGAAGVRRRLLDIGVTAPVVGDLAGQNADTLLDALVTFPEPAAYAEAEAWLAGRQEVDAARELLAAARGDGPDAPARRLACQQTLSRLGTAAEPALREVLDDRQLGGLARVWLTERGAADVPAPDAAMVFWLTIDTIAAQLDVGDDPEPLRELVRDLVDRHDGFFDAAWRVDHPATADVLEAMGRLHPDRGAAKAARKAAFRARSVADRG
ncbi:MULTISPECIES: hypothetical protein [Streptomycetaceae]|uniref:Uncharacterized protein n=1 Tax=Streptantibioticus cattleyicolor (strain ATCC 35852 / DSM 46488 / JCM 4925 / NBRC 14057 / NRRL 8057) TaxID=1003195 RepID=F8JYX0_STREN|nr:MULTISPECIES: hypothetical protein [Streptomycetaceae]AEW93442.1 hypothetical protein SCATT_10710 [Streptantibioticus cattleyicolor NRRL 8057 = DSM 46488]MYS58154.1 hypothetical protein [Streptomyces sp. SID5468]CCB73796.1 conserved protein of unknown function [Streptantibioticus cattleyicolor NRRL 8057 = DSM 46488]